MFAPRKDVPLEAQSPTKPVLPEYGVDGRLLPDRQVV